MMRVEFGNAMDVVIPFKTPEGFASERKEPMSFKNFLMLSVKGFEKFKKGPEMSKQYNQITAVIEAITDSQRQVDFENDHFKLVKASVDSMSWLTGEINGAVEPHYDSVAAAYDPAKKKAERAAAREAKKAQKKKQGQDGEL